MVDGLCAIQNLQRRSAGGGSYSEGSYMPVYTVADLSWCLS